MTVETFAELAGQPAWMIRCLIADGTHRRPKRRNRPLTEVKGRFVGGVGARRSWPD